MSSCERSDPGVNVIQPRWTGTVKGFLHPKRWRFDWIVPTSVAATSESGEKRWEFPIERRIFSDTTADGVGCHPVVTNDTMYVGANGGYVYATEDENQ